MRAGRRPCAVRAHRRRRTGTVLARHWRTGTVLARHRRTGTVLARHRRTGTVLARRHPRELQEHVIERRAAQPEIADADTRVTQRRSGVLDELESITRSWKTEPIQVLARLRIAAAHPGEHGLRLVALSRGAQLDLEDLPADAVLQLIARALRDNSPAIDHRDPVRKLIGLLEVLSRQQDRRPLADELPHDPPDLVAASRIEPGGRLVEKQNPRAREQ